MVGRRRESGEEFAAWYSVTRDGVIASLMMFCGDWDAASDAGSEAFVRAYERWSRVREMERPDGWVYQVGVNVLRRRARRAGVERRALRKTLDGAAAPVGPIDPDVWHAVRELPDRERHAIALRYVVGLTQAEIAEVMHIAPGTVAATLSHARTRLATLLETREKVPE